MKINWRYALGEISIVIIGISIAFALNNWAAHRSESKTEKRYFRNLEKDLNNDLASLDQNIQKLGQDLQDIEVLVPHLGRQLAGRDTIYRKIFTLAETVAFIPEDATYHTLVNAGDFKLISDFELKSAIEKHYRQYQYLNRQYERRDNFSKNYMADFFVNLDYDAIFAGKLDFLDNKRLRNMIFSLRGIVTYQISAAKAAKESAKNLLAAVESES